VYVPSQRRLATVSREGHGHSQQAAPSQTTHPFVVGVRSFTIASAARPTARPPHGPATGDVFRPIIERVQQ
jgi:hypothetical protein